MLGSNVEWGQYYQQTFMGNGQETPISGEYSDGTIVTKSSPVVTESISGPSSSYSTGQLTPTRSVSKPIRRRSRVSKKTPITLLNANANNFRALVQQFTGCSTASSPISFGGQKGPINLSFGPSNATSSPLVTPFGNGNYNYHTHHHFQRLGQPPLQGQVQEQQQQQQQRQPLLQLQENQQFQQEQQCMYPIDNVSGGGQDVFQYSSSSGYNPVPSSVPSMEIVDGFVMDQEDLALHEFSRDLFSN